MQKLFYMSLFNSQRFRKDHHSQEDSAARNLAESNWKKGSLQYLELNIKKGRYKKKKKI